MSGTGLSIDGYTGFLDASLSFELRGKPFEVS